MAHSPSGKRAVLKVPPAMLLPWYESCHAYYVVLRTMYAVYLLGKACLPLEPFKNNNNPQPGIKTDRETFPTRSRTVRGHQRAGSARPGDYLALLKLSNFGKSTQSLAIGRDETMDKHVQDTARSNATSRGPPIPGHHVAASAMSQERVNHSRAGRIILPSSGFCANMFHHSPWGRYSPDGRPGLRALSTQGVRTWLL